MAHVKNHDYHVLPPSIWPFLASVSGFVMLFGAVLWMHGSGPWIFLIGAVGVAYVMVGWWGDVIRESRAGDHTAVVDIGLRYAEERVQFGKALIEFPRVANKLALTAVEIMIARQLTYFSAWEKDHGHRCDLEAGMAKLLGVRVAWASADNALQIHGGNGFALEYPISRVLCDARILNIFEGAAEIQAQVIARRLLG